MTPSDRTPTAVSVSPEFQVHAGMANAIRALAMDAVQRANSGHPGMPMGMADVATVLFGQFLHFDPDRPDWPDRDRFVLSAGHGSMLLYALLHLTGYPDMTLDELRNFRQLGSRTAGHPEYGLAPGIETTTGPLGQGLANAVGMALAERLLNARFGRDLVDHYTYAVVGDGCLMEGISQEAITLAGHLGLGKLVVLFDDNRITIDGRTELATSERTLDRFRAAGWDTFAADGHQPGEIYGVIAQAKTSRRPSLIACRTTIAYGAPTKADTAAAHGAPLGEAEIAGARERLDWPYPPFEIPEDVVSAWREVGAQGAARRRDWEARLAAHPMAEEFRRVTAGALPEGWRDVLGELKARLAAEAPTKATRVISGQALAALTPKVPELIGGSADLTGSVATLTPDITPIRPGDFAGRYIHYGVREHAMAAVMNGLALHRGLIPYAGTFLVFTDYCKPALRLSALMGQRVIYVMTHDSIGLGEDGPTHQPIEHLAALRAVPNLNVFRPADPVETVECWELALAERETPSILALSRQGSPTLRTAAGAAENPCARGAYVLAEAEGERRVTLLATGTEVALALEAREALQAESIPTAVVSMPCWRLFDRQDADYRDSVLGPGTVRVAVEAASALGWERYTGCEGAIVAMHGFGASAPAERLFEHFGITSAAVAAAARELLG